jgi:hypothetical protein
MQLPILCVCCAADCSGALTLQVNLGHLLTGLGSCALLHPQDIVLSVTVWRLEQYECVLQELQQSLQEATALTELGVLKQLQQANVLQNCHQPHPAQPQHQAQSVWHQHYKSTVHTLEHSHVRVIQALQTQHDGQLLTLELSHTVVLQAHRDELQSAQAEESISVCRAQ